MAEAGAANLRACPVCGLIQRVPGEVPAGREARCRRCRGRLGHGAAARSLAYPAAFSLAALVLYPLAMTLPVLRIERLGHTNTATIWSGAVQLITGRQVAVGVLVFVCSVVVPLAKILGMFLLCTGDAVLGRRHRSATYRAIDWVSRWGMLDVLLVAILVAAVKLGDWIDVAPGPGIAAFAAVVVLSLLASATFDPRAIWEE